MDKIGVLHSFKELEMPIINKNNEIILAPISTGRLHETNKFRTYDKKMASIKTSELEFDVDTGELHRYTKFFDNGNRIKI